MRVFNTLGRKLTDFSPREAGHVRLYTCGPTVYNVAHIGNLRTFVFEDVLRRHLKAKGWRVTQVMNLTDIDDKTIKGAAKEGVSLAEFTGKYSELFFKDLVRLNVEKAEQYPMATDHVPEMIALIEKLKERGHTYESEGSVWFKIATFPGYGKLSQIDLTQTRRGDARGRRRVREGRRQGLRPLEERQARRAGLGLALGAGAAGWHIECSAMSMKYLGRTSTCTPGRSTTSSRTTRTRSRRAKARPARPSSTRGCTPST